MAASTTQRLTLGVLSLIYRYCLAFNCGVIVRLNGEDVGVIAADLAADGTWANAPAKYNTMTIPKATIATMESDFAATKQTAIRFVDLTTAEQDSIRDMFGVYDSIIS